MVVEGTSLISFIVTVFFFSPEAFFLFCTSENSEDIPRVVTWRRRQWYDNLFLFFPGILCHPYTGGLCHPSSEPL